MDSDQLDLAQSDIASQLQALQQSQAMAFAPSVQGSVEQPMVESQQPTREQSLKSLIEQQMQSGMNRRQKDIDLARMLHAEKLKQSPQVDLTNFFGIANAAGADPRNASYKAPVNYDPMAGQAGISKEEGAMTDDQLAYLKAQLEAENAAKALASKSSKGDDYNRHFDESKVLNQYSEMGKKVDKIVGNKADFDRTYQTVNAALTPDKDGKVDLERIGQISALAARNLGNVGTQTEQDAQRNLFMGMSEKWAKIAGQIERGELKVDASIAKNLRDTMNEAKEAMSESSRQSFGNVRKFYSNPKNRLVNTMYSNAGGREYLDDAEKQMGLVKSSEDINKQKKILSPSEYFKK